MTCPRRRAAAGMTLLEVLIAVTILALIMVGMSMGLRMGLFAFGRTSERLMDDRRVAGAQRILQSELEGMMPVTPPCLGGEGLASLHFVFFQAEAQYMRMISTFSLKQGWRGAPQVLEFFIIPGAQGRGVRLVVNESPYTPSWAGSFCRGTQPDPMLGVTVPRFAPPPEASPNSFVLADNLAFCKFSYYVSNPDQNRDRSIPDAVWLPKATGLGWPLAIRIDMAPMDPDLARLQPIGVVAAIHLHRAPEIKYVDQ